jgi:hypothetical protein
MVPPFLPTTSLRTKKVKGLSSARERIDPGRATDAVQWAGIQIMEVEDPYIDSSELDLDLSSPMVAGTAPPARVAFSAAPPASPANPPRRRTRCLHRPDAVRQIHEPFRHPLQWKGGLFEKAAQGHAGVPPTVRAKASIEESSRCGEPASAQRVFAGDLSRPGDATETSEVSASNQSGVCGENCRFPAHSLIGRKSPVRIPVPAK